MMRKFWSRIAETPRSLWLIYWITYLTIGGTLQLTAPYTRVARFAYDWQVITLYGFYLVPISILLRGRPWHMQYAYALTAIAPIDIIGFTLHTSLAFPHNLLDSVVGERNFTLTFVVIASWIPYCGNLIVEAIARQLPMRYKSVIAPPNGDWSAGGKYLSILRRAVKFNLIRSRS